MCITDGVRNSWKLTTSMAADDVKQTLDAAIRTTVVNVIMVKHRPRLLSDNGPCYISSELKDYLGKYKIEHTRGAPYHPMTQGKIERYHRSIEKRKLFPSDDSARKVIYEIQHHPQILEILREATKPGRNY